MSADISARNNDIFQTTLKLGIIRENITSFLLQEILKQKQIDIIENNNNKDGVKTLKKDILETEYPEIVKYLNDRLSKSESRNKTIDLDRELNSFLEGLLLEYFIKNEDNVELKIIQKELNKLEQLKKIRNSLAHTINFQYYDENWINSIKKILKNIAKYLEYPEPQFDNYKEINVTLLEILKQAI